MQVLLINKKLFKDTSILVVLLALFVAQLPLTIAASYILSVPFFLLKRSKFQIKYKYIGFCSIVSLIFFLPTLTFNHGITPLFYLMVSPFLFLMVYDFSKNSLSHIRVVLRNTYWIFVILIVSALVLNWEDSEPLGAILPWVSTNGVPSYLIVVQIAYSLTYYLKSNRLPLFSAAITLVVAIFGLGRGSMIVGFLIFTLSFFINITVAKSKRDRLVAFKVLIIVFLPFILFFMDNTNEIIGAANLWIERSKFSSGILDEHRGTILSDYINKIDGLKLIFGTGYENTSINVWYGGNPHNSYIRVHSFYGLFGLIFVLFPLVAVLISRKQMTQKFVFALFILLMLLRAVTEPIFFPSTLDYFYCLCFFVFFRYSKDVSQKKRNSLNV